MAVLKLTEAVVKRLPFSSEGQQRLIYDSALTGFGIRVSSKTKSFFAERRLNGKTKRITVGPYPILHAEEARRGAQAILGELVRGIDRKAVAADGELRAVALAEAFRQFKQARQTLAPRTVSDYEYLFDRHLRDWLKRPWTAITPAMVLRRHSEIGKRSGGPTANHVMRALGSVLRVMMKLTKSAEGKTLIAECPTAILSDAQAWFPERAKDSYIKPHQLPAWWAAVTRLANQTAGDFFRLLLLIGLRYSEAATLRWADVDFEARTITIGMTKNKKTHVLPLTDYLAELLKRRRTSVAGPFVFPGEGRTGHIVEIKKNLAKVNVEAGVKITCHDLRRTFSNCLESIDVPYYALKKLMNHSVSGDVTARHYLSIDVERLRVLTGL